jgi:hypothetical protein
MFLEGMARYEIDFLIFRYHKKIFAAYDNICVILHQASLQLYRLLILLLLLRSEESGVDD